MHLPIDNLRFRKLLGVFPLQALEILYKHYQQPLLKISITYTHYQPASEEIVQDAFLHIWEHHQWLSRHHDLSIQFYLFRIVKNRSISWYKKNRTEKKRLDNYANTLSNGHPDSSIEMKIIALEIHQQLQDIIHKFPRREQQCLLMKTQRNMKPPEIAVELGVSLKAVERSLTSANKRLRKILTSMR